MRSWLFWGAVVLAGLLIGAGGATGTVRVAGLKAPARGVIEGAEALASGLPAGGLVPRQAAATAMLPAAGGATQATPAAPKSLFDDAQVVSYYGQPLSPLMGVLGEGTEAQMLARLKQQAAAYQAVNDRESFASEVRALAERFAAPLAAPDPVIPHKKVVPALHLIYEVAQATTDGDGLYLYRTPDETVLHYVQLTQDQGMLLFLDLQIARSSLANELNYVLPYLKYPHVHLALDPEFVTPPGSRPGLFIGTLDCLDVNAAIQRVEALTEEQGLPNKIVLVHQFTDYMLANKDKLDVGEPRVDVVLNMDGFGGPESKLQNYNTFVRQAGIKYGGIKLFYRHDTNLLSEQQVEDLDPRPAVIIYQ